MPKKAKSKVKSVTPHAKLEAMPLAKRIAAVAADVDSKRDEYRSSTVTSWQISWVLMNLVGLIMKDGSAFGMSRASQLKTFFTSGEKNILLDCFNHMSQLKDSRS